MNVGSKDLVEFKELVFDLMNGLFNVEEYQVAESRYVKNEFAEGKFCAEVYDKIYDANLRLCEKLGTDEDIDLECIISGFRDLITHLSMKMYDYGAFYAQLNNIE